MFKAVNDEKMEIIEIFEHCIIFQIKILKIN